MTVRATLRQIFLESLEAMDPAVRTAESVREISAPLSVVAIGKAAARMFAGTAQCCDAREALVVVPEGYELDPRFTEGADVIRGGHPGMTPSSFEAGRRVMEFVARSKHDLLFLISGGGSACVELPLEPWFSADDLMFINDELIRSGQPITSINTVRKHLSAIKGGRLGVLANRSFHTCIYSDVPVGHPELVASGPTVNDSSTNEDAARILEGLASANSRRAARILTAGDIPETPKDGLPVPLVAADNGTLVAAASEIACRHGFEVIRIEQELEGDVDLVAEELAALTSDLRSGCCLVAGGEPTVVVRGNGRGGRCSELAARFLRLSGDPDISGLFAATDGLDGNSGTAGFVVDGQWFASRPFSEWQYQDATARSDTFPLLKMVAEPIIIPATGNNLRDLVLLARE